MNTLPCKPISTAISIRHAVEANIHAVFQAYNPKNAIPSGLQACATFPDPFPCC